ncbi:MAG: 3-hydroxyacyl-CoA dehydrogenase NAD-binding domain-containing protein [Chloroflexota bacterium]|nr:3-hydroxyacyl-CoA dehydrogenase NAD-binding domain-containing protein [Chloroflexota bacterium]
MSERKVLVCGAGLMGHGIAQAMASAGHSVALYEPETARAEAGRARIAGNLERAVAKGRLSAAELEEQLERVSIATSLDTAAGGAELIVEAVFEDEQVKRRLYHELDQLAAETAILASNTSSISITRLATSVSAERRPRFVGVHFFSPVPLMPLIELVRGAETDDATEGYVRQIAGELEKRVIVSRDRPGFIVNRMLMPFLAEAMRAYEEGLATAEDIDAGARLGLNHPMGPLELADFIGLDVCLQIMEVLQHGFAAPHHAPPPVLRQLVDAGRLGQKSGRGFYTYPRD